MLAFAISPILIGGSLLQIAALALSFGGIAFLLARRIKKHFLDMQTVKISLSLSEFFWDLLIIIGGVSAGFYAVA
jgi:hypothetical protein